jgi:2-polyprenyl-3-methyl-5-hydroxy-6-metoxy-1,4-benzoquinol methylase
MRYSGLNDRLFGAPGSWNVRARDGMFWLDPAPAPEDIMQAYATYHTHAGDVPDVDTSQGRVGWYHALRQRVWSAYQDVDSSGRRRKPPWQAWLPPVREQLAFDRAFLDPIRGGKVLDVGCGSGELVDRLKQLGWAAKGIDPDPRAVEQARSLGRAVERAGVETLDRIPETFDAVTMIHVIEHVYHPMTVLKRVLGLLKPGGKAVIVTPNAGSLCSRFFGRHWRGLEPPRHLQLFNKQTLQQALNEAGFKHVTVRTSFRDASGMFCASYALWRTGRHTQGAVPRPAVRLLGDAMLSVQWLLTRAGLPVGEELVAIAERD